MTTGDIVPGSTVRNTSQDPALNAALLLANLAGRTDDDPMSNFILGQEAQGQREFVNSTQLPTQSADPDAAFEALGIVFGEPDPSDPLFRPATLPAGWRREGTDHSMHSNVVDQYGRQRIGVFYKAAFYDRRADMRLVTPDSYLRSCLWDKTEPVLDEEWLTADVAVEALDRMRESELEQAANCNRYVAEERGDVNYWAERAAEHHADAAAIQAMSDRIRAGAK